MTCADTPKDPALRPKATGKGLANAWGGERMRKAIECN